MALHYVTLRYITLHYVTLRYITLHYVTLRYITLRYVALRYVTLRYVTLRYVTLRYITLHYVTLRYITLHYVTLLYITLHYVTLRYITLHYVTLRLWTSRLHLDNRPSWILLVQQHWIDYCNVILVGLPDVTLLPLWRVMNAAAGLPDSSPTSNLETTSRRRWVTSIGSNQATHRLQAWNNDARDRS